MEILREWERIALPGPQPRVGVELMAGRWTKTNEKAQWIGGLDVRGDGDDLLVPVAGGGAGAAPADWGIVRPTPVRSGGPRPMKRPRGSAGSTFASTATISSSASRAGGRGRRLRTGASSAPPPSDLVAQDQ